MAIRYLSGINVDSNTLFVDSTNNRVGIGTAEPTGELHIYGSQPAFRIQSSVSGNMQFGQWDTTTNRIQSSGRNFYLVGTDDYDTIFGTNNSEKMRIKSGGNVLIGTTTDAGYKLYVSGTGTSTNLAVVGNIRAGGTGTAGGEIIASGALGNGNFVSLRHDDTNAYITVTRTVYDGHLILQPYGNVGIGTTSPGFKLDVTGAVSDWASRFSSNANAAVYLANGAGYGGYIDAGTNATSSTYVLSLVSNGSTRVYVQGDGMVGIGTGTPSLASSGIGLEVVNNSYTQLKVRSTASSAGIEFKPSSGDSYEIQANSENQWFVYNRTDEAYRLLIADGGNVLIGTITDAGYKLRVNGTGRYDGNVQLYADSLGNSPRLIFGSETSSTDKSIFLESYYMVFQGHNNEGFKFQTTSSLGVVTNRMSILGTGTIQLSNYGSGSKTGTVAYNLAVDSSGNIIETAGGVVDGSGTANMVAKWSDANTLTDSGIEDTSSYVSIGRAAFYSPSNYGTAYSAVTGASGGTAWFDTVTASSARLYNITIFANPNSSGSGSYKDFYYGKIIVGNGYNGSAVVDFINYHQESPQPRSLYDSGGGNLTVTAVFVYGGSEVTEVPSGATYIIRIKISGYVNAGAGTQINLQRIM